MKPMLSFLVVFLSTLVVGQGSPYAHGASTQIHAPVADAKPPPTVDDGKGIWMKKKNKCISCHGKDGKGQTKMGKAKHTGDMTTAAWQKGVTDQQIKDSILKGVDREKNGKRVKKKPLAGATEWDAEALTKFIRAFAQKQK